jgi:alpha-L-fucosidase 2
VEGDDLVRLGYKQGTVTKTASKITYNQEGWGGFTYQISVQWRKIASATVEGVWSISSQYPQKKLQVKASQVVSTALQHNYVRDYFTHINWWSNFWSKSSIRLSDSAIEKQWYLEQYKFGSASRRGAPPISLQAVWTADNGRLPPWKGDYHHDLNTQLSYWPCYSGNHLYEGLAYFDHLDENKANYKRYTKLFFGKEGLAVPGVTTLDGTEMGGWIQYSGSPTVSAWLAHHYYLQWRYSMDRNFLKASAYPWFKEVATFLENITRKDEKGYRQLPLSSSPEINNNKITAWFLQNTNYDLSLMKFTFAAAAELANELGLKGEARRWQQVLAEFSDYALTEKDELMFAPTLPYNVSHRHFSNMMAIHPLSLIRWEDGAKAQSIIKNSTALLDKIGPKEWCGYSYSWLANIKARAKDGEGAARDLDIFMKAFCSPNTFHLNGDQTKSGFSSFTYRPFTLEGNFAFASGLQEMLLQSYAGFIEVMPAVPARWTNISFKDLRAEGAFLVSAKKAIGKISEVTIIAEKGGKAKLKMPFSRWTEKKSNNVKVVKVDADYVEISFPVGGQIGFVGL